MIAILTWVDGDNCNETCVKGIYPNYRQAEFAYFTNEYFKEGDRWQKFEYGSVDFNWDEANKFPKISKKKK